MAKQTGNINASLVEVIRIAQAYAKENINVAVEPSHLFKALLHKDAGLVPFIEKTLQQDYYYLQDWADVRIKMEAKSTRPEAEIQLSDASIVVIEEAEDIREKLGLEEVDARILLASIVTPGVGFSFEQLKSLPLQQAEILNAMGTPSSKSGNSVCVNKTTVSSGAVSQKSISKYCKHLNPLIANGEVDPVIGFDRELSEIYDILGRRTKPNILITSESGVGKTSLIHAFVQAVVKDEVPTYIQNAQVYEVDLTSLTMEVSYKSEVEGRMKKVLEEISSLDNAILVIEGLDKILDKQGMLYGVAGLLKNKLNEGLLTICTSTIEGYTKNIETDKELTSKFEHIQLEEPSLEYAKHILDFAITQFERFHGLKVDSEVTENAIRLAKRYFNEKHLPDAAIDMIDRTMALIKATNDIATKDIRRVTEKVNALELSENPEDVIKNELKWIHLEITNRISPIVVGQVEVKDLHAMPTVEEQLAYIKGLLAELSAIAAQKIDTVSVNHLLAVVAQKTGIPMGNIQSKEREKLVNAEEILKKRVVGQDHAIKIVLDSIFEARSGLNKKGQPMGSFFFLGPTGTGKTELAKSLADFLFQDETAILRFDMSEYKEEHSVALLYGAPPGYVGYEEGGLLVNQIRQKPYSVVLFDEIEKAHRSVFDLFLQILDEGKLHDRLGRVGDFSNALILFTSNIGSQYIFDSFAKGVIPTHTDMLDVMQGNFRPEFLARLTEIVPFSPITEEIVLMIFNIHLKNLLKTLAEQHITLDISEDARHHIAMRGFNAQYGARPILGIIRKDIRRPLSKMIISGELKAGDKVSLQLDESKQLIWEVNK